jgi:hypothetical protein
LAYSNGTIDKFKLIRFKNIIETLELEDLELLRVQQDHYSGYPEDIENPALYKFQNAGLILVEFPATSSDQSFTILDGNGSEEEDTSYRSTAQIKLTNHGKIFMNCLCR